MVGILFTIRSSHKTDTGYFLFAVHIQGWSPEPEEYKDLPQKRREGQSVNTQSPYIQIDLLKPYNITGKDSHRCFQTTEIETADSASCV